MRTALAIIAAETERLSALIARLLDWARMESGKRSYDLQRQPVGPIVDTALRAVEALRLQTGAAISREVPPGLPDVLAQRLALGR